jgi:Ca2+-binding RTX toxin-like protein
MKSKLLKITLALILLVVLGLFWKNGQFNLSTAYAVGELLVDWGVAGTGDVGPVFNVSNFTPGDEESRTVNVENSSAVSRAVAIKGVKTSGTGDLEEALEIIINDGTSDLYGGTAGFKTLQDFFNESNTIFGLFLFNLNPAEDKNLTITVKFMDSAGNEYQNTSIIFNIIFGITIELPAECQQMDFDNIVLGTAGNDRLNGGVGSQLIIGLEGNDKIDGGAADDCIVAGLGNDQAQGGAGSDVVDAGEGNDKVQGGAGNEVIYGGLGNDDIQGDAGEDLIHASSGNDTIRGGAGDDEIYGEDGQDNIFGDAGNDYVEGGNGADTMHGGPGGDELIGGAGADNAHGQIGQDTCDAEVEQTCEI